MRPSKVITQRQSEFAQTAHRQAQVDAARHSQARQARAVAKLAEPSTPLDQARLTRAIAKRLRKAVQRCDRHEPYNPRLPITNGSSHG